MNTPSNFIPSADPASLSKRTATALHASAELLQSIMGDMPPDRLQTLEDLLKGGGRVGLEFTVDRKAASRVALVAVEREGARRVLAEVSSQQPPGEDGVH